MRLTIVIALLAGVRTDRITTCNVGSNVCECTGDNLYQYIRELSVSACVFLRVSFIGLAFNRK